MENYLKLGKDVLANGEYIKGRSGGVYSLFGKSLTFDLAKGFPLLTSKHINFDHIKFETKWYLSGSSSIKYLKNNGVNIWNLWADENDELGPTYGVQWRNFEGVDQVANVIEAIKHSPDRRMIINGWNPIRLDEMRLPPCLVLIQYHLVDNKLHCTVYQRSADIAIGVPYDIAEMALLQHIIANTTSKEVGTLTMFFADIHLYEEHISNFEEQLKVLPKPSPQLEIDGVIQDINSVELDKINLRGRHKADVFKYKIKE